MNIPEELKKYAHAAIDDPESVQVKYNGVDRWKSMLDFTMHVFHESNYKFRFTPKTVEVWDWYVEFNDCVLRSNRMSTEHITREVCALNAQKIDGTQRFIEVTE